MKSLSKGMIKCSRLWLFLFMSSLLIGLTACTVDRCAKKGIFRLEDSYPQDMLLHEKNSWDERDEPIKIQQGLFITYSKNEDEKQISFLNDQQNTIYSFPANPEYGRQNLRILKNESVVYCISTVWKQESLVLRDKAVLASDIIIFSETGVPIKVELGKQEYAMLVRGDDLYYYCKKKIYKKSLDGGEATLLKELQIPTLEGEDDYNYFRCLQFVYTTDWAKIFVSTNSLDNQDRASTELLALVFFD